MKREMWKTTVREIRQSLGRFLAIFAIVALGVSLFAGLRIARPFMLATTGEYLTEKNFYDFQLLNSYGFEAEDLAQLAEQPEVRKAAGAYTYDVLTQYDGEDSAKVMKLHTITEGINGLEVIRGRMPESVSECVVDSRLYGEEAIGRKICLTDENKEETLDCLAVTEFTIVGIVQSSRYIQFERGNTSLGNGTVSGFFYVRPEAVESAIYTEIFVKLDEDFSLYEEEYEAYIDGLTPKWEDLLREVSGNRYERLLTEARQELDDAREEFLAEKADAEAELKDAEEELAEAEAELSDAKIKLADAEKELTDGRVELSEKEQELADAEKEIAENEKLLLEKEQELKDAMEEWTVNSKICNDTEQSLLNMQEELISREQELLAGEAQLLAQDQQLRTYLGMLDPVANRAEYEAVSAGLSQVTEQLRIVQAGMAQVRSGKAEIAQGLGELQGAHDQLALAIMHIWDGERQLEDAKTALSDGKEELAQGKQKLADGRKELADAEIELQDAQKELADGEAEYLEGLQDYKEGLAEFEKEIADAEKELAEAEADLEELEEPDFYVLGRDTNIGYVCLENDSTIISDVAKVFPVFFFLVAALVCMTTMNRMIEEQRTQIGVLKALGYSNGVIMTKYLFYSGSAAVAGSIVGYIFGTLFFPKVVWSAYGIMYDVAELTYYMDWPLALISLVASMVCSMGVTWYSCRSELVHVAASLMRPKAPKAGKRVMFEYIPFLWKRLKFLQKVSIRNVLRYKKRFFMMIVGISGCTALLVAGFGILDSIKDVVTMQYEEIILYDMSVTFRDAPDEETRTKYAELLRDQCEASAMFLETAMDIRGREGTKSLYMIVPEEVDQIGKYIRLHNEKGEKVPFPKEGEVVLTGKLADTIGVKAGDSVTMMDEERQSFTVTVSGICENFIYNYAYLHPDTCKKLWKEPEYKSAYIKLEDTEGVSSAYEKQHQLSAALLNMEQVSNVTLNQDVRDRFESMMGSLNYIVMVIILCATALAFIVLYNLTNINITERVREIATIKVLGFTRKETATYVFRDNLILTALGAVIGLFLGKIFHAFMMSCIRLEIVAFDVRINSVSYLYSFLLTFVFAWFVNLVMTGKIKRISMTESLKSVD